MQIARATGANVIATTSSSEKGKLLSKLGANHVINYRETPKWDEEVLKLVCRPFFSPKQPQPNICRLQTNGRGVDHVVEVAGPGTIMQALNSTRLGGWIHSIGFIANEKGADQATLLGVLLSKNIYLRGVLIGPRVQCVSFTLFVY